MQATYLHLSSAKELEFYSPLKAAMKYEMSSVDWRAFQQVIKPEFDWLNYPIYSI